MSAEEDVAHAVSILVSGVEAAGAAVIGVGAVIAFVRLLTIVFRGHQTVGFLSVRLTLGRYLVLGLEFQLAADVLRTAIAPSFHEIGQLAATAAIRTALNWVLAREIAQERNQIAAGQAPPAPMAAETGSKQ